MKMNRRLQLLPAIAFCLPSVLSAQIDRANLKGTVSDTTGAAVSNAVITVFYPQTGFERTVQSTSAGEYVLSALPLGRCNVSVVAAGFEAKHIDDIDLQVGEFRTVNLQLSVGAVEQTVAVAASTVTLDQDSAATGGVIARAQVENLPINGRNWAGLMILVPGAINTGSGNQTSIRFAGHGVDDNRILFDGVDASGILRQSEKSDLRIQLASESIREFRVNSALYSAEYGGTPGGQGDVVSRSGTNNLHGSVYEFLRNDVLNARALFSTRQLPLRLNQFGGRRSSTSSFRTNTNFARTSPSAWDSGTTPSAHFPKFWAGPRTSIRSPVRAGSALQADRSITPAMRTLDRALLSPGPREPSAATRSSVAVTVCTLAKASSVI